MAEHQAIKRFGIDFYARVTEGKRGWTAEVRPFKLLSHVSEADAWATIRQYAAELLDAAHEAETACHAKETSGLATEHKGASSPTGVDSE